MNYRFMFRSPGKLMVFNSLLNNSIGEEQLSNIKSEGMSESKGCTVSPAVCSLGNSPASHEKSLSLFSFMLLVRKHCLFPLHEQKMFSKDPASPLNPRGFRRRKHVKKSHPGRGRDSQGSNECFLPGLHDDLALDCLAWACRSDYSSLGCLNKRFKQLVDSGYLYQLRRRLGIVEHWVYVSCSLMPWEAFDPTRHRWMRLPIMPCDECFSYADKESLAVGTQLLVFGREITGFAIWMYSLVRRVWSRCEVMNLPRCLFASGSCKEIAIVAGGSDKNGRVLKTVEVYNSETMSWQSLPDMNVSRKMCSGFFMDGKFYVIGGMSSSTDSLTCGEEYNLETRTWRRILNMYPGGNRATQSPPLVAVVNNQLYAADQATNEVKKYNKESNTWRIVKRLPVRADSYNGWGLAFKACGDKLLVIGGHRGCQGDVIMLHSWRPEEDGEGADWHVLSVRERAGAFVYNCAVMGC